MSFIEKISVDSVVDARVKYLCYSNDECSARISQRQLDDFIDLLSRCRFEAVEKAYEHYKGRGLDEKRWPKANHKRFHDAFRFKCFKRIAKERMVKKRLS